MQRIRGADTSPELALRSALHAVGLRYRLNLRICDVRPDLVFTRPRVAVFIDGCLWHGCPLHYTAPRTRTSYWQEKLARNVERDIRQTVALRLAGWRVVRLWEHALVPGALQATAAQVATLVRGGDSDASNLLRPGPRVHRVDFLDADVWGRRERWVLWDMDADVTEVTVERDRPTRRPRVRARSL